MFLVPLLPDWLFEGPPGQQALATPAHQRRLRRPWTDDHTCAPVESEVGPPLRDELRRLDPLAELDRRVKVPIRR